MRLTGGVALALFLALSPTAGQSGPLADLAWLEGEWQRETPDGMALERWRVTEAGLVGAGLAVLDGKEQVFEALMIVEMAGDVFYVARPPENPYPVGFRLTSHEADTWVFENPTHDFPQRIIYRRTGPDAMSVAVDGPAEDGGTRGFEVHFGRARRDR